MSTTFGDTGFFLVFRDQKTLNGSRDKLSTSVLKDLELRFKMHFIFTQEEDNH